LAVYPLAEMPTPSSQRLRPVKKGVAHAQRPVVGGAELGGLDVNRAEEAEIADPL
jgi:hypothetical protein